MPTPVVIMVKKNFAAKLKRYKMENWQYAKMANGKNS